MHKPLSILYSALFTTTMFCFGETSLAEPNFSIQTLSPKIQEQLRANNIWQNGCPVQLDDLRLISASYYDFDKISHDDGEIVVHKDVAQSVVKLLTQLYTKKFPFTKLSSLKNADDDWHKATINNFSFGFVCKKESDRKFATESFGKVITLNPVENPEISLNKAQSYTYFCKYIPNFLTSFLPFCQYFSKTKLSVSIFPPTAMLSINRKLQLPGMTENITQILTENGWQRLSAEQEEVLYWDKFANNYEK